MEPPWREAKSPGVVILPFDPLSHLDIFIIFDFNWLRNPPVLAYFLLVLFSRHTWLSYPQASFLFFSLYDIQSSKLPHLVQFLTVGKAKGQRLQILSSNFFYVSFAIFLSSCRVLDAIQRFVLFICCTLYMANLLVGAELYGSGSLAGVS